MKKNKSSWFRNEIAILENIDETLKFDPRSNDHHFKKVQTKDMLSLLFGFAVSGATLEECNEICGHPVIKSAMKEFPDICEVVMKSSAACLIKNGTVPGFSRLEGLTHEYCGSMALARDFVVKSINAISTKTMISGSKLASRYCGGWVDLMSGKTKEDVIQWIDFFKTCGVPLPVYLSSPESKYRNKILFQELAESGVSVDVCALCELPQKTQTGGILDLASIILQINRIDILDLLWPRAKAELAPDRNEVTYSYNGVEEKDIHGTANRFFGDFFQNERYAENSVMKDFVNYFIDEFFCFEKDGWMLDLLREDAQQGSVGIHKNTTAISLLLIEKIERNRLFSEFGQLNENKKLKNTL